MFKVSKETDDHYLITHKDGHFLKIAKKNLSPQTHETIKKLACGGQVNPKLEQSKVQTMADGGEVEDPTANIDTGPAYSGALAELQAETPNQEQPTMNSLPGRGSASKGFELPSWMTARPTDAPPLDPAKFASVDEQQAAQKAGITPAPQSNVAVHPAVQHGNQNVSLPVKNESPAVPSAMAQVQGQQMMGYGQAFNEQLAGMKGMANVQSKQAAQQASAYEKQASDFSMMQNNLQTNLDRIQKHIEDTTNEINNGKIDPNRMWHNKSTGAKVGSIIGMLLSGVGSGLSGQRNMAMDVLNKQIDNDIDAQKANLGQKKTALEGFMHEYGNVKDASAALRLNYLAAVDAQMGKIAAQNGGAMAQQQYLMNSGKLKQEMMQTIGPLAMSQAAFNQMKNGSQGNPEMMIRMSKYQGASEKETDKMYDELKGLSAMQKGGQKALEAFDKVNQMALAGAFKPGARDAAIDPVVAQLSKDTAGRFTEQDAQMLHKLFPAKLDSGDTRQYKRQKLLELIQEKMNSPLLDAYGIPKPKITTAVRR